MGVIGRGSNMLPMLNGDVRMARLFDESKLPLPVLGPGNSRLRFGDRLLPETVLSPTGGFVTYQPENI